MKLIVDDKWSVIYDPKNNDRPIEWLRHGERHGDFEENNAVTAMFYALLECRQHVKAAFEEGFVSGAQDGWANNPRMNREWKASRAKRGLGR